MAANSAILCLALAVIIKASLVTLRCGDAASSRALTLAIIEDARSLQRSL